MVEESVPLTPCQVRVLPSPVITEESSAVYVQENSSSHGHGPIPGTVPVPGHVPVPGSVSDPVPCPGPGPGSSPCLVLGLRVSLSLVRFCLLCGQSLQDNLLNPLDHILGSACFVQPKGNNVVLEVQLHPEDDSIQQRASWNQEGWSEDEEEEEKDSLREEKPKKKKFMNDIARERHSCCSCPSFFHSAPALAQHTVLMHNEVPASYPCSICSLDFLTLQELCKHATLSSLHEGRLFECFLCSKKVRCLAGHMETHIGDRKHICPVEDCGLAFVQKVSLTKHLECHGESRFRCEQCGDKFFRAESLRSHLKKIHDQEETFQCTYCGEWFLNHDTLKSHSKYKHKVATPGQSACKLCGEYVLSSRLKKHFKEKHIQDLEIEQSPCQFCGMQLNSLLLRSHMRNVHPNEDPETQELERIVEEIVAPVTKKRKEKKLEAGLELEGHTCSTPDSQNTGTLRSVDTVQCPHCEKPLLETLLAQHIQAQHSQVAGVSSRARSAQQFSCLLCGHQTKASWFRLIKHFSVHPAPSDQDLACPVAEEDCLQEGGFKDLASLHRHYWTRHKSGVECNLCHMVVKNKAYMEGHMTGHSTAKAHPCNYCPKSFKTKIQLDIHESRHTGQGKYECSICGKRFPQKGEVKNHEMQHGEERGFTCDHCGKSFARDAYLRIHMKTHNRNGEGVLSKSFQITVNSMVDTT